MVVDATPRAVTITAPMIAAVPDRTELVTRILVRPLFSPTRRPIVAGETVTSEHPSNPPRLSGILVSPNGNVAIFQPDKGDRPVVLGEGGYVERWRTQIISKDEVTLTDGSRQLTLRPSFGEGSTAVPQAPLVRARDASGRHTRPRTYLERHG